MSTGDRDSRDFLASLVPSSLDSPAVAPLERVRSIAPSSDRGRFRLERLSHEPPESVVAGLHGVLDAFSEVEFAALCGVRYETQGNHEPPVPSVVVYVNAQFRQRLQKVGETVERMGNKHEYPMEIQLLDDEIWVQYAKQLGKVVLG